MIRIEPDLLELGYQIIAISADHPETLQQSQQKHKPNYQLLSDSTMDGAKALGIDLPSQGCAQLSMNLLDAAVTPMWRVWEEAEHLAAQERVSVLDSELIGLAPLRALVDVADHIGAASYHTAEQRLTEAAGFLRIRRFEPSMVLEVRLAQARQSD